MMKNNGGKNMKQIIVLISSIVLGVAIAAMVIGFEGSAQTLTGIANSRLTTLQQQF